MSNNFDYSKPSLIDFTSIGSSSIGYISVAEEMSTIPFEIKRVYWTYFTPQNVTRGGHANIHKELVLVAVCGTIQVTTVSQREVKESFILDNPSKGLFLPKLCWHTMQYSHNAVQMVLASSFYSAEDYIRDYDVYLNYGK